MGQRERYMGIEAPATKGTVDFISEGLSVEVTAVDGKLLIHVNVAKSRDSSEFLYEDFEVDYGDYQDAQQDEDDAQQGEE